MNNKMVWHFSWLSVGALFLLLFLLSVRPVQAAGQPESTQIGEIDEIKEINEIEALVHSWAKAWKAHQFVQYMACYSGAFSADYRNHASWKNFRESSFSRENIVIAWNSLTREVDTTDATIDDATEARVQFDMLCATADALKSGRKLLQLSREKGTWFITEERWLRLEAITTADEQKASAGGNLSPENVVEEISFLRAEGVPERVCVDMAFPAMPTLSAEEVDGPKLTLTFHDKIFWRGHDKIAFDGRLVRNLQTFAIDDFGLMKIVVFLEPSHDFVVQQLYDEARASYCVAIKGTQNGDDPGGAGHAGGSESETGESGAGGEQGDKTREMKLEPERQNPQNQAPAEKAGGMSGEQILAVVHNEVAQPYTNSDDILGSQDDAVALQTPQDLPAEPPHLLAAEKKRHVQRTGEPEELRTFFQHWLAAWEKTAGKDADFSDYMDCYSKQFRAGGYTKRSWLQDKRIKNRKRAWIRGNISRLSIEAPALQGGAGSAGTAATVRFELGYQAPNYSETLLKIFVVQKEAGQWKIISEKTALKKRPR